MEGLAVLAGLAGLADRCWTKLCNIFLPASYTLHTRLAGPKVT